MRAAAALFRKRGYEQTRVRDIIERLRISEVTFFNYFPSKDALIASSRSTSTISRSHP